MCPRPHNSNSILLPFSTINPQFGLIITLSIEGTMTYFTSIPLGRERGERERGREGEKEGERGGGREGRLERGGEGWMIFPILDDD